MKSLPTALLIGLRVRDSLGHEGTIDRVFFDNSGAPCIKMKLDDGRVWDRTLATVNPVEPTEPNPTPQETYDATIEAVRRVRAFQADINRLGLGPMALAGSGRDGAYPVRAPERTHVLNLHLEADTPDLLSAALEQIAMRIEDGFDETLHPTPGPGGDAHHHYHVDLRTNAPIDEPFLERVAAWRTAREEFLREHGAG